MKSYMNGCGVRSYVVGDVWPDLNARRLVFQQALEVLRAEFSDTLQANDPKVNPTEGSGQIRTLYSEGT